jgi:hypothetical protein
MGGKFGNGTATMQGTWQPGQDQETERKEQELGRDRVWLTPSPSDDAGC